MRWHEVTGEQLAARRAGRRPAGDVELQIVRTVPEHVYGAVPRGDFRILESYMRRDPQRAAAIYLENQFLWSPEIAPAAPRQARRPADAGVPAACSCCPRNPKSGDDDTRGVLAELIEADGGNGRLLACALYARSGARADPIYVHAKVGIVDDRWLTLGSANLNEHSLFNDTEMNVVAHDPDSPPNPPAALGRAPRAAGRPDPGRPDAGDRRALEADQQGTARAGANSGSRSRTGSSSCRTSRDVRGGSSARSTASSSTADARRSRPFSMSRNVSTTGGSDQSGR